MLLKRIFLAGCFAGFFAAPATAFDIDEQLRVEGEKLQARADANGLTVTKVMSRDRSLGEGGADMISLKDLPSITNYVAIGICDSDCSGLGLSVEQKFGIDDPETLAQDIAGTTTPVVEFLVAPFSEHSLTVSMLSCSTLICGYAVDIYRVERPK